MFTTISGTRRAGFVCWRCQASCQTIQTPKVYVRMSLIRHSPSAIKLKINTSSFTVGLLAAATALSSKHQRSPYKARFTTSSTTFKKSAAKTKDAKVASDVKGDDVQDFSVLEQGLARVQDQLKQDLSKLRAGGRFNPQVVDDLRVSLIKGSHETVRLGDLAQVVPKGRVLTIIVGESDHIKAVSSAIASSNLSLTPQADPHNPLQLDVQLPPPTSESRKQAIQEANKAAEAASGALRNTRQAELKRLQAMRKVVRPDDYNKAIQKMEKLVQTAGDEVKKTADSARKVLENF